MSELPWSRSWLEARTEEVLRQKRTPISPRIALVRVDGIRYIYKDFASKSFPVRTWYSPFVIRREEAILKRLEGIPGIPAFVRRVGTTGFVTEYIEGRTIGKFRPGDLPDAVYRRLEGLVAALHERRVAHLDLRQRKNVLLTDDQRPHFIDFANSLWVRRSSRLHDWILDRLCAIDRSGLLKYKHRLFPHLVTDADRSFLKRHNQLRRLWLLKPARLRPKDAAWR